MSIQCNLIPTVTLAVDELNQIYSKRTDDILKDIKFYKMLLKSIPNSSKIDIYSPSHCKERFSTSKISSLKSPKTKTKPFSPRNSTPTLQHPKSLLYKCVYNDENHSPTATATCKLDLLLQKGLNKDVKEFIDLTNDYFKMREKPNKLIELEKQKFLLQTERMWEQEIKTFELFEPGLATSLQKYISVIQVKAPKQQKLNWRMAAVKTCKQQTEEEQRLFEEDLAKIRIALNKDLASVQLEQLKSEEHKPLMVKLYQAVTFLSDIRKRDKGVVFKKEPWQNIVTYESK